MAFAVHGLLCVYLGNTSKLINEMKIIMNFKEKELYVVNTTISYEFQFIPVLNSKYILHNQMLNINQKL